MVAQNKQKYAAALSDFDDLDSPEATKVRQAHILKKKKYFLQCLCIGYAPDRRLL